MRVAMTVVIGFALLLACKTTAKMSIVAEATETASAVFKASKDEARIKRDNIVSERLGELSAGPDLTVEELQPLKGIVKAAKADGSVTPEEADRILVEM